MSGPDLPQPIYPTPGHGPRPGAGGPAGAGPGGPPTYSVGPPTGGGPQGPKSNQTAMFAAIGVAVVVLIGVAILVVTSSGGDDPPSTAAPTTDVASGGGTEPGPGASTDPEVPDPGGEDDLAARAQGAAALILDTDLAPTEACLAEGLVDDPDLLALIEPTIATGVTLNSPDDAARYAATVMSCASPLDVTTEIVQSVEAQYDQVTLGCIEGGLSALSAEEWALFIEWGVQPSRSGDAEGLIAEATSYC